jgi:hypothetical protein
VKQTLLALTRRSLAVLSNTVGAVSAAAAAAVKVSSPVRQIVAAAAGLAAEPTWTPAGITFPLVQQHTQTLWAPAELACRAPLRRVPQPQQAPSLLAPIQEQRARVVKVGQAPKLPLAQQDRAALPL